MGRNNSKPSIGTIGSHGHAEGTRPDQTRKTPKDLSAREREERGCGEGVGLYAVYMRERGGRGRGEFSFLGSVIFFFYKFNHSLPFPQARDYLRMIT